VLVVMVLFITMLYVLMFSIENIFC